MIENNDRAVGAILECIKSAQPKGVSSHDVDLAVFYGWADDVILRTALNEMKAAGWITSGKSAVYTLTDYGEAYLERSKRPPMPKPKPADNPPSGLRG